jgi:hypothetical protein
MPHWSFLLDGSRQLITSVVRQLLPFRERSTKHFQIGLALLWSKIIQLVKKVGPWVLKVNLFVQ